MSNTHELGNRGQHLVKKEISCEKRKLFLSCNSGSTQEELEATVLLDNYDLAVIPEIWWDGSHDWSVTNIGHRLFRRDLG